MLATKYSLRGKKFIVQCTEYNAMDIVQNQTVPNATPELESRRTVCRSEEKDGTDIDAYHPRHGDVLDVSFLSWSMPRSLSHTGRRSRMAEGYAKICHTILDTLFSSQSRNQRDRHFCVLPC